MKYAFTVSDMKSKQLYTFEKYTGNTSNERTLTSRPRQAPRL